MGNYMGVQGLLNRIIESSEFKQIRLGLERGLSEQAVVGLVGSQKASYIAGIRQEILENPELAKRPLFVVTYTSYQAKRLITDLATFIPENEIYYFPAQDVFVFEEAARSLDLLHHRLRTYSAINKHAAPVLIIPVQALAEKLIPPKTLHSAVVEVTMDSRVDIDSLASRLVRLGYNQEHLVEAPAQFSIRGGIIDIYPPTEDYPVRIELFDDEVDSLRCFDPETQRSINNITDFEIVPATEFILPFEDLTKGLGRLEGQIELQTRRLRRAGNDEGALVMQEHCGAHLEKLQAGISFDGAGQYRPYFYNELVTLLDYMPGSYVLFDEPARAHEHLRSFGEDFQHSFKSLLDKGHVLPGVVDNYIDWYGLMDSASRHSIFYLAALSKRAPGTKPSQVINVHARSPELFHGKLDLLRASTKRWKKDGFGILIVVSQEERGRRLVESLSDYDIFATFVPELNSQLAPGSVLVSVADLETGFELPEIKMVVLTENEIFGKTRPTRRMRSVEDGVRLTDFAALKEGDYVVHVNHGIGRYQGLQTLEMAGVHKDYLVVQYAGTDKLYVPTEQVGLLQKYVGSDSDAPKLYKLGGGEWARVKNRVKESVQEIAEGLIELYAKRQSMPGHKFGLDTLWQREFEESFPYQPTPDQIRAVAEVKKDMQTARPMDRLLCGDVGYGKTEVAIRAAFKAVMDGKQVAVLVPTTILAQQHYRTFVDRFQGYPVTIHVLSRFQTPAEQNHSLELLKTNGIDIIIGTHRLLSQDVHFKDLGLVIVDEEQRFGVVQKERLKELRQTVDVLTLTATPIPRTLHMSLVGVRDVSLIETPPENRYPIRTYVIEYNDEVIREAIYRELAREGQIYFVYNRVQSIDRMAAHIAQLAPEARVAVAHGQMDETRLEQIMLDFLHGEYDILLCTTIIETGMDIANVNTLIVYDADYLGLAQLYQLRGRVGRTNRVAYAYFTYRKDKLLTEVAEKRLQAIKEFTELGSGFKIAMRDLEIRGAGNLLGPEQHGFIASVGFELYCRLLDEAVRRLKGESRQEPPEAVIDLDVDAYLPDTYVTDITQKVELYKRLAAVAAPDEANDLLDEIEDRFGEAPVSTYNIIAIARIKAMSKMVGIGSIAQNREQIIIRMLSGVSITERMAQEVKHVFPGRVALMGNPPSQMRLRSQMLDDQTLLKHVEEIVLALYELQAVKAQV
ncbi:MAG: transcription-repair coupling factor [Firmicutes bacterium]|nr:transcription-repair coupling factor [Bacillota bacterium]